MKNTLIWILSILLILILSFMTFLYFRVSPVDLVNSLYLYDPNKIKEQDKKLENILSPELYKKYTLQSDHRQMRVYLKFNGLMCKPVILSVSNNRVVYYLETSKIDSNRTFQLEFKSIFGKVTDINESELFYLFPSDRGFYE